MSFSDDPAQTKIRPVLVIDPRKNTAICLRMTSKPRKTARDYEITRWREAGLAKPTIINTEWRIMLKDGELLSYIGQLSKEDEITLGFRYLTS